MSASRSRHAVYVPTPVRFVRFLLRANDAAIPLPQTLSERQTWFFRVVAQDTSGVQPASGLHGTHPVQVAGPQPVAEELADLSVAYSSRHRTPVNSAAGVTCKRCETSSRRAGLLTAHQATGEVRYRSSHQQTGCARVSSQLAIRLNDQPSRSFRTMTQPQRSCPIVSISGSRGPQSR